MQRIIWLYGIIAGVFLGGFLLIGFALSSGNGNLGISEVVGYLSMLIAMSLVVVGIKRIRDRHLNGTISFGKAFMIGMYIVLIANVIYSGAWTVYTQVSDSNFYAEYYEMQKQKMEEEGIDEEAIDMMDAEAQKMLKLMENPFMIFGFTFITELLPVGFLVSLISALILKRKSSTAINSDALDEELVK